MKAAEAKLAAVKAERRRSEELAGDISLELVAADRKSFKLENQAIKLEKQIVKLKEERAELKKQVVGDGKVVINEKIYTRQQAELASYRKKIKISTLREQSAEAMVPYRDDLEKIKEMIHDVEETGVARPSLPQFCVAAPEVNEMEAVIFPKWQHQR